MSLDASVWAKIDRTNKAAARAERNGTSTEEELGREPEFSEAAVSAAESTLRFQTPAEVRASTPPEPDWVIDGYAARGVVTLGPAGKPKVGKSTLGFAMGQAVTGPATRFLGRQVVTGPVVYLTEESTSTLLHKLPPEDDPNLHILTRDAAWPKPEWHSLMREATAYALENGALMLVVDTLPYWAGMPEEREKDSGAAQAVIGAALEATRQGLAVMLPLHTRKSGGEDGDAIRGSTAFAGAADIVLELERPSGQNPQPRHRNLLALSRYPQTPGVLMIEHDVETGEWSVIGEGEDRRDTRAMSDRLALLDALPASEPGMTRQELEEEIGVPHKQFAPVLSALMEDGQVHRDGAGKRGDPFRFRILRNPGAQKVRRNGSQAAVVSGAHPFRDAPESTSVAAHNESCAETLDLDALPLADPADEALIAEEVS